MAPTRSAACGAAGWCGTNTACVWHRRAGKDKTLVNLVVKKMTERVGTYYYFFPTYRQGKKFLLTVMDRTGFKFTDHIPHPLRRRTDNSEMLIELKNGSVFQVIGTDNMDSTATERVAARPEVKGAMPVNGPQK